MEDQNVPQFRGDDALPQATTPGYEQKPAEEGLHASEQRYRILIEALPQLVWIAGPDGMPQYFNKRWHDYTGCSLEESIARGWGGMLPAEDQTSAAEAWQAALRAGQPYEVEYRLRGADGAFRWFLTRGVPLRDHEGTVIAWLGTCTDIHQHKAAEDTQRFLADLSERIRTTDESDEMLWEVLSALGEYLQVSRCGYGDVNASADEITIHRDYCRGVSSMAGTHKRSAFGSEITADLTAGKTVVIQDARSDPRTAAHFAETYRPTEIIASINVPIMRDGRQVATLAVQQADRARLWSAEEIALVETLSERIWLAVDNARLRRGAEESALRQRNFLRDVLASVTDGKLRLCESAGELPASLPSLGESVSLSPPHGLQQLRRRAQEAAASQEFSVERRQDLVTATGEAAMNAIVHAGGGVGSVCGDGGDTIQVWIVDQGQGIDVAQLPRATLEKGFTTAGTLGHGMKMMLATIDRLWLLTNSRGTTVVLEQERLSREPEWLSAARNQDLSAY